MRDMTNFELSKKIAALYDTSNASGTYYHFKWHGEMKWDTYVPATYSITDTLDAFSIKDLFELMPYCLIMKDTPVYLSVHKDVNGYSASYADGPYYSDLCKSVELVDALGELFLYLLEKGYIKGKNEEADGRGDQ